MASKTSDDDYQGKLIEMGQAAPSGSESLQEHLRETMATDDEARVCCCASCGSTDIVVDAYARWDEAEQDWVLAFFTERKAVSCMACSKKEGELVWKRADEIEIGEEPECEPEAAQSYMDQLEERYGTIDPETGAFLKDGEVQF